MKLKFSLLALVVFIFQQNTAQEYLEMIDAGTYAVSEVVQEAEAYFADKDKGRGTGYKQFKRWEYMANRLQNESGYLPTITENLTELQRYNQYLNETAATRQALNDNWLELGPFEKNGSTSWNPGVGRITGIAIDQTNTDHIIIGANTGGVWRTLDGGENWEPLGDTFTNLTVYAVTIDPSDSDTYYFGSSSGLIFKSTDAGATWTEMADMSNSLINKIVIDPSNNAIMYACSQNAGIFRSADSGATWNSIGVDGRAYDVEFKPGDPTTVYASGEGFHVSTDSGVTFATVAGLGNGPKMIGVSPDDSNRVYVLEADGGSFGAFYMSTDSGATFIERNHAGRNYFGYDTAGIESGGQAPRDMDVAVNPDNADEVHIAGVLTWRSADAGVSFSCTADWIPNAAANANIGYCHADVDLLLFQGTTLYAGTDGGIFKAENTSNVTADYYEDITAGIGIRQWYKIGISQTPDVLVTGGSQDNGSSFYDEATGIWTDWIGADGMEGFVDKDDPNVMYGMIQFGGMYRTDDGANNLSGLNNPASGNWVTPFEQDPVVTNTIYAGFDRVYKSTNKGNSWAAISQSFPNNLNHLKIAPSNNQIMYLSVSGQIFRTEDGGATNWSPVTSPNGQVNSIAIHPTKPNTVAVAIASTNKVLVSHDGGENWESMKLNLPDFSALAVVWHDNGGDGLYVGMDYGIYYIDAGLTEWQPFSNNLPNVIINELEIHTANNELYAASYGRGLWVSPTADPSIILGTRTNTFAESISIYPNPAGDEVTVSTREALSGAVRIYDATGKLVIYKNETMLDGSQSIAISSLQSGVYFVRINTENGTATKKLLKK
ncbi:T9SS type A sorting domain-containing protein [Rasiella rasia]|uniref:T9SS type A sorting domain-containing protein n=1 Tax=Rasiella rasia TaxID=2744027 RepID=A0A6G6GKD2_9FLAO|nr:T9SS type A sorting domain-containing protein [Rasiella rasia]QIE59008.1 T9SS type A sorting domain-containing protein [Rasiella rasia]